ncbi:hypothetical protein H2248_012518 [Termitomyces sp. 'cryptogamus']|nr:hypothetical protein H2248_012518 [Termitomyces sp. 'cryptogamus']
MFTSPSPWHIMRDDSPRTPALEAGMKDFSHMTTSSHRVSHKPRWTVILVPVVLTLITAFTRYLHPSAFDRLDSLTWHGKHPREGDKQPERRQVSISIGTTSSSAVVSITSNPTTSVSMTAAANAPVPTIPSSPPTLPTPFPQPFDSDLTINSLSSSCYNFISNMTNGLPFRSCRPLSLLMDGSNAFIDAQSNLALMNSIIWGTCNTDIAQVQCIANMGWFADTLQAACVQDLQDRNQMAVSTLRDLQAYALMRHAGCLPNPASNSYCYLEAVGNSDLYFYSLPLEIPVPNGTKPRCTACTHSLMSIYSSALSNSTEAPELIGLQQTYGNAAKLAVAQCGTNYADTIVTSAAPAALLPGTGLAVLLGAMLQILS